MQLQKLPADSVRGRIRAFIERQADKLGDDVLEVGSRMTNPHTWWIVNRDLGTGRWMGLDMQPGHGVDRVQDIHQLPEMWTGRFSAVLCSEVLEHVARPWLALPELRRVLRPGGWLVVTTLFAFPEHGFPNDYYRYTDSGLKLLLKDAGFANVLTEYAGETTMRLNDHGEAGCVTRTLPIHTFAIAQC
jgi:SAM-dependent methyltransferase